mgnify:CR=1 FL=1
MVVVFLSMFGAPAPPPDDVMDEGAAQADEMLIARARATQATITHHTRTLCEILTDLVRELESKKRALVRKRAQLHSVSEERDRLLQQNQALIDQNSTLRYENNHLQQRVASQAAQLAQMTLNDMGTTPERIRGSDDLSSSVATPRIADA